MYKREVSAFNAKISYYLLKNDTREAISVLQSMKHHRIIPNHVTFSKLIGASGTHPGLRETLHAQSLTYGMNSDMFVGSSLVKSYSNHFNLSSSSKAFGDIDYPDIVSFNIMIDSCVRNNCKSLALRTFLHMSDTEIGFDSFTLTSMLKTCSESRDLTRGSQIHCRSIKCGFHNETALCNSTITMYTKCDKGATSSSVRLFEHICKPNVISWTAIISGLMQNGKDVDAAEMYEGMSRSGVRENGFTFSAALAASSNLARLDQGRQIHARVEKSIHGFDRLVNNSLIDMYSKCGSVEDAYSVFMTMGGRDVVSYTVMMTGFGKNGRGREAVEMLLGMERDGLRPDGVTFLACLSACSHGGLVDEGVRIFKVMSRSGGLKMGVEHFSCVVDMFGRAGRLSEAEGFINEMGLEKNLFAWEAFLGACRIHGEIALGQLAAKKAMDLHPSKDGPYVLLSNIYADSGLWEDKGLVRDKLDLIRVKKEVGNSWVGTG